MRHPKLFNANIAAILLPLIFIWLVSRMMPVGLARMFAPGVFLLVGLACLSSLGLRSSWRGMHWLCLVANALVALGAGVFAGALLIEARRFVFGPSVALLLSLSNFVAFWGLLFVDDTTWSKNGNRLIAHWWLFVSDLFVAFWGSVILYAVGASLEVICLAALGLLNAVALLPSMPRLVLVAMTATNAAAVAVIFAIVFAAFVAGVRGGVSDAAAFCTLILAATNLGVFWMILRRRRRAAVGPEPAAVSTVY